MTPSLHSRILYAINHTHHHWRLRFAVYTFLCPHGTTPVPLHCSSGSTYRRLPVVDCDARYIVTFTCWPTLRIAGWFCSSGLLLRHTGFFAPTFSERLVRLHTVLWLLPAVQRALKQHTTGRCISACLLLPRYLTPPDATMPLRICLPGPTTCTPCRTTWFAYGTTLFIYTICRYFCSSLDLLHTRILPPRF